VCTRSHALHAIGKRNETQPRSKCDRAEFRTAHSQKYTATMPVVNAKDCICACGFPIGCVGSRFHTYEASDSANPAAVVEPSAAIPGTPGAHGISTQQTDRRARARDVHPAVFQVFYVSNNRLKFVNKSSFRLPLHKRSVRGGLDAKMAQRWALGYVCRDVELRPWRRSDAHSCVQLEHTQGVAKGQGVF
jgi:hypothetical protein